MRLEITAKDINVIATEKIAFFSIEDENGSRVDVTLTAEMLDYLEQKIADERRVAEMIAKMATL